MKLYGKGYKLVWEDHFDGPKIDEGYWDILHYNVKGCGGRPAWRKRENCRVENSNLIIHANIEENGDYVSGMLRGNAHFAYKYGYAEIRAKLPIGGKGIWPGFWMCVPNYNGRSDVGSEIDVFEMFGDDSYIESALHSWWSVPEWKTSGHLSYDGWPNKISPRDGSKFSDDFHTIGYEWTPELVAFYVDGEAYGTVRIDNELMKPFHNPIYFILSMAFGLPFLSAPDDDRTEPIEYIIDYIRLYQNEDGKMYHVDDNNELIEVTDPYSLSEFKK